MWYVQNVSTFPNTFAVVSPLICVFWIQLTWTNAIFSRIALVSHFCAEIQLSIKIREKLAKILFHQKTHKARRWTEGEAWGLHTHRGHDLALAVPAYCEGGSAVSLTPPSAYIYPLTWKYREDGVFPRKTSAVLPPLETMIWNQKLHSGTLLGRGFRGDLHHHHHRCHSIDHPWLPYPCVSNSPTVGEGMVGIGWDH
jgi:hypothetical protein